jgi:hypothetical protein
VPDIHGKADSLQFPPDPEREIYQILHHIRWLVEAKTWDEIDKVLLRFPDLLSTRAIDSLAATQATMMSQGAETEVRAIRHRLRILAFCNQHGAEALRSVSALRQGDIPWIKVGELIPSGLGEIYQEATTLEKRYELSNEPELLERFFKKRLELLNHPNLRLASDEFRWEVLNDAAIAHRIRFAVHADTNDLRQSIELSGRLVKEAAVDYFRFPGYLCNLGNAFQQAFDALGEISNLQMAIEYFERSMTLNPDEIMIVNNLNSALAQRFNTLGAARSWNGPGICLGFRTAAMSLNTVNRKYSSATFRSRFGLGAPCRALEASRIPLCRIGFDRFSLLEA